jgi:hypothetical protein
MICQRICPRHFAVSSPNERRSSTASLKDRTLFQVQMQAYKERQSVDKTHEWIKGQITT